MVRGWLAAGLLAAASMTWHGGAAAASGASLRYYAIPKQALASALTAFARQSGLRLAYPAELTRNLEAPALDGALSVEEGLNRLLAGSSLAYRITGTTVTVFDRSKADFSAQATGAKVELDLIEVEGKGKGDGKQTNGPTGVKGYVADNVSAATKTNTPLLKVPQSISVVTRESLDDRDAQTVNSALSYTPGVQSNVFGFEPRNDGVLIRGFGALFNGTYRDGLRVANDTNGVFRIEPYGLDAITILRGPSAATYGFGAPGGILDLTSKRPVFTQFAEVQTQFGNFDRKQANFDIGGPVQGTNGTVAYRVSGVFRDSNLFPVGPDDRINIAPTFTIRPNAATSFTFLSEYMKTVLPGTTFFYQRPNFVLTNLTQADPAFLRSPQEEYRVGYAFEHRFSDSLVLQQNLRYSGLNLDSRATRIISDDGLVANRASSIFLSRINSFAIDTHLEKRLDLGPTKHVILAGIDFLTTDVGARFGTGDAPPLDLLNLNYGRQFIASPAVANRNFQSQSQLGVYAQDQIDWGRATLTLSGRRDGVNTTTRVDAPTASYTPSADEAFTGRAGLNYMIVDGVAPYVSYATTFVPNLGTDANQRPFQATRGDQKEVGIKTQIPSTNLHVNGAVFDINATNVLRPDPNNILFQSATGAVRSRGYEVEVIDNIAPGTNIVASYTHLDIRTVRGAEGTDGKLLSGIPGDSVSAFAKYRLTAPGPLGGLSVGGGIRYAGWSFVDDLNTGLNRAFTLFDAVLAYELERVHPRFKGVRAQVNGYNIFDRYATNCQAGRCYRVQPATVIGSLIYRW